LALPRCSTRCNNSIAKTYVWIMKPRGNISIQTINNTNERQTNECNTSTGKW